MSNNLEIKLGQYSSKGKKSINQDFYGALFPDEPKLSTKGIAIAIADGISSSPISQIAAQTSIKSFLSDYYCTSDSWSVKNSAQRVISATNSWAYAQTKRSQYAFDREKGYVCTFSALIIKGAHAHIFHIGDSRIYRIRNGAIKQLTDDHRLIISSEQNYLSRAIGMDKNIEIDYRAIKIERGDYFIMLTDGIYNFIGRQELVNILENHQDNLDIAARKITQKALKNGSDDNLTIQIAQIINFNENISSGILSDDKLPFLPYNILREGNIVDGYKILRAINIGGKSHVYLAISKKTGQKVCLKTPSTQMQGDDGFLQKFMMEEWVASRVDSDNIVKPIILSDKSYIYNVFEYAKGKSLAQWIIDNPYPDIEDVRLIIEQIAKALRAFHRKEMVFQDLHPKNIIIDNDNMIKIVDFGSVKIAGIEEASGTIVNEQILGSLQYSAPEIILGGGSFRRSDYFSLGVIAYQMLTGKFPYGSKLAKLRSKSQLRKITYKKAYNDKYEIAEWIDGALKKATHLDPYKRYDSLSEFILDLRRPNKEFLKTGDRPLLDKNPVMFWQLSSLILFLIIIYLLVS